MSNDNNFNKNRSNNGQFKKGHKPYNFTYLPADEIVRLYTIENKSCTQIAKIYNVSYKIILRYLDENGIPRKENGYFNRGKKTSNETKLLLSKLKKGKPQPQLQTKESRLKCGLALRETHKQKSFGWGETIRKIRINNGTDAEIYFESLLKNSNILNYSKQHMICTGTRTRYSIDFAFPSHNLAIELDGESHINRKKHDEKRDLYLASLGWKVIRYTNLELFQSPHKIIDSIKKLLN